MMFTQSLMEIAVVAEAEQIQLEATLLSTIARRAHGRYR